MTSSPSAYPPHRLGRFGEELAARLLVARGWRILARNYKAGRREIDLVLGQDRLVVFVEVKTRSSERFGRPPEAVTPQKRREIEAVALDFLTRHAAEGVAVRFDVIGVTVDSVGRPARVEHIEDAWRPGWT